MTDAAGGEPRSAEDSETSVRQLPDPVFVVGSGRSGSSFIADVLSRHADAAFLTRLSEHHPQRLDLNRAVMHALDVPGIGRLARRAYGLEEAYGFWEAHAPGFTQPVRDLRADDVTARARSSLRGAVSGILVPGRRRFLAKFTGWSRIGYLNEVFSDARFVHLVRDGRDVANSLLAVEWWRGWRGPHNWRFGLLPPDLRRVWEKHDRSYVALAGLCWRLLVDAVETARRRIPPERFVELRYEDFVERPHRELERVLSATALPPGGGFFDRFDPDEVRDVRGKHRRDLTRDQQRIVADVTREPRERYGYA